MITLSLQLYSARNFDLTTTLAQLAEAGVTAVEGYGGVYDEPAALSAQLQRHGLQMPSGHFAWADVRERPQWVSSVAHELGIKIIVVPYLAPEERPQDQRGWRQLAQQLDEQAEALSDQGFSLAWHNHDFEYAQLPDGSMPLEILLDYSTNVQIELDVGWVFAAQHDPVAWLQEHSQRVITLHIKDCVAAGANSDEDGWADIGHGLLDWPSITAAAKAANIDLWIMEHDKPSDVGRFIKRSTEFIRPYL